MQLIEHVLLVLIIKIVALATLRLFRVLSVSIRVSTYGLIIKDCFP